MHPDRPHYDVVVVGARAAGAATAMLLARAGLDVLVVDRSRYGADTLSTHALMRAGVLQLHRWGAARPRSSPPAPRRCGAPRSATPTSEIAITHQAVARCRRAVRPTPHACSTRSSSTPRSRPAPTFATASPSPTCARDRTGRVAGIDGRDGAGRRLRHRCPARRRCRRPPLDRRRRGRCAASSTRAPARAPSCTATGPGSRPTATSGSSGPAPCAGLIPTNDDLTCVFAGASPRRIGRGGLDVLRGGRRAARRPDARRPRCAAAHRAGRCAHVRGHARLPAAGRGGRAGRSSATPATGRTRSAPTASPTRSATPSCSPVPSSQAAATWHGGRGARRVPGARDRLSLPLFAIIDAIAAQRWGDDDDRPACCCRLSSAMADEVDAARCPSTRWPCHDHRHPARRVGPPRRRGLPVGWPDGARPPPWRPGGRRDRHRR